MEKEFTEVYCGGGKGKTTLAIGQCLRASAQGKSVIIIQFLKEESAGNWIFWRNWIIWILRYSVLRSMMKDMRN